MTGPQKWHRLDWLLWRNQSSTGDRSASRRRRVGDDDDAWRAITGGNNCRCSITTAAAAAAIIAAVSAFQAGYLRATTWTATAAST